MVGLDGEQDRSDCRAANSVVLPCLGERRRIPYSRPCWSLPFRGCYGVFRYRSSISSRNGRWTIQLWTRLEKSILGFKMKWSF
jgi:hypothetical protein